MHWLVRLSSFSKAQGLRETGSRTVGKIDRGMGVSNNIIKRDNNYVVIIRFAIHVDIHI